MSSLGFQTIYRLINSTTDHVAERCFLPDTEMNDGSLLTYETQNPVGDFDIIAVSVAYELEITQLLTCFERIGIAARAEARGPTDPLVVLGGPITFSNPRPFAPFADIVVMGEAEPLLSSLLDAIAKTKDRETLLDELANWEGVYVPSRHGDNPVPLVRAKDQDLPAFGQIVTPDAELSNMHLVEAERGCHRSCTFCVMRRSGKAGMRTVSPKRILLTIPEHAPRVGLVGAAVADHPQLMDIFEKIIGTGRGLGVSSLRADRLTPALVQLLKRGGYRTLTIAADGASQRLRDRLKKGITREHFVRAAELAVKNSLSTLKLYAMLGLPTETEHDVDELIALCNELSRIIPLALAISPFVSKRNTPLDGEPFAGIDLVEARAKQLRKGLQGRAKIRSTSAKWAWVEYVLAQGGSEMAEVAQIVHENGGNFAAWRKAMSGEA